jgi:predicted amidohydrolase
VVLPISFFERAGPVHFNSVAVIDADGAVLPGVYRKSHIPDGPGYTEKFYFSPGDTGFRVFRTRHAALGVGICWDQARLLVDRRGWGRPATVVAGCAGPSCRRRRGARGAAA